MRIISKILSYIFAIIVILTTGNIILSIIMIPGKVDQPDWLLIFALLLLMLMGVYYIGNDLGIIKNNKIVEDYSEERVLDENIGK